MFIPIGDINPKEKTPVINYIIIGANVSIYILFGFREDYREIVQEWGFTPARAEIHTLFTSMFLHADIFHLLGNMLFLWITGDNVENKLGHLGYLFFYITGGLVAVFAHDNFVTATTAHIPTIGASGAISAVMAAYVVLFPWNKIIVFYWFYFYIGKFHMSAIYFFGFWILFQILYMSTVGSAGGVAYAAHVGGFVFGLVIIAILLILGVIKKPRPRYHYYDDL